MIRNENGLDQNVDGLDKGDLGSVIKNLTSDAVEKVRHNASKYYEQGIKQAAKLEKTFEKSVGDNPMTSLLVAAGLGLAAGFFFNRRKATVSD